MAVSGGFRTTVGGLRISARSPLPILLLAVINFTTWLSWARRAKSTSADLASVWRGIERHATRIVFAIALTIAVVTAMFSTRSAAGADASGYVSESAMLSSGRLFHVDELSDVARGRDPYLTSPLGWRPASSEGRQSPTYPPGLPMLMAVPHAIAGLTGASALVIASALVAVIATGLLAAQIGGSVASVLAALLLAFTPVFVFQSIQPMSDVPVTAAWMICLLFACGGKHSGLSSGVACAVAILIRPNLAPLAIVPFFLAKNRVAFSIPVAIAGIFLAVINWVWYGSPLRSGYGNTEELFALANIGANATRYFSWTISTTPVLLLAVLGFWRRRADRAAQAMFAFAMLVVAAYLAYAVFDDWSYLRFLLPALAVFAVFTAIELSQWIARAPEAARAPVLFALLLAVSATGIFVARSKDTFRLASQLQRVEQVADYVRDQVESSAVLIAGEQSGAMRYYTGHSILRWEAATADAMTAAIGDLDRLNRPIYIVLDAWEDPLFRAKFLSVPAVGLDWPPMLEAGTSHRTKLWKLSDRERFVRGGNLTTIRLP